MEGAAAPATLLRTRALTAALLVAFAAATLGLMVTGHWSVLQDLHVPVMDLPWYDARTVSSASIALERGLDPLIENPADPEGRVVNYPRVWLALAACGLRPEHTWVLAWAFVLAFLGALPTLLPLARTRGAAAALLIGLAAPTTWLALERANSDLAMFAMCALAALFAARRPVAASLLIACATLLKLFPIAAGASLCRSDRARTLRFAAPLLLLFAIYVVATFGDILLMHGHAPRAEWLAYGIDTLPMLAEKNVGLPLALGVGLGFAALALAATAGYRTRMRCRVGAAGSPHTRAAFRIGASVYVATFLIGQNFDYRLMFLMLALPQLALWTAARSRALRNLARTQLALVLLLQWSLTWRGGLDRAIGSSQPGFVLDELLSWTTWAGLCLLLLLALPEWLVPANRRGAPLLDEERQADLHELEPPITARPTAQPQRQPGA